MRTAGKFFSTSVFKATALLFSTIVGAGIFGIPFVFAQLGAVLGGFLLIGLGVIMWAVHRLIGELVIATHQHLQLTGFVRKLVGPTAAWLMAGVFLFLHLGALVAYLIGAGESLAALFGGSAVIWSLGFFGVGVLIIIRGVRTAAALDSFIAIGVLIILLGVIGLAVYHAGNLVWWPSNKISLFTAYGVFLFALHGTSAMPGMEIITGTHAVDLRRAINWGSLIPVFLYLIFALTVVAVTGQETTTIATVGLGQVLGLGVLAVGNVFAVLAMGASFITIGQALISTFRWDFGVSERRAVVYAVGLPLLVFLAGARSFISVVSFVGATAGTIEVGLIILAYYRWRQRTKV